MEKSGHRKHAENSGAALAFDTRMRYNDKAMKELSLALLRDPSLKDLPQRIEAGLLPALVSGLSPVHRPLLAAALYESMSRPLVVVCPEENAAEAFARDMASLLGKRPYILPSRDYVFRSGESASRQTEQTRLRTLDALREGKAETVICSVSALLQRTLPPDALEKCAFTLRAGDVISPETVVEKLLRAGYTRTEQVEGTGQFAARGGIIDLFSPASDVPVRVDFWGDEIDGMGYFDIEDQRRTENLELCRVLPASETVVSYGPESAENAQNAYLYGQLEALLRKVEKKGGRLPETLTQDMEKLKTGLPLVAADRYMPLLYDFATATDYLPPDALVLISEPGRVGELGRGFVKQNFEDIKELIGQGILYGGGAVFSLSMDQLKQKLEDYPVVMADAFTVGKYIFEPRSILGARLRQLPSYGGSAETAIGDVKHYLEIGHRVVLFCGDERRAKLMHERLQENGVSAAFAASLTALPEAGNCLVSVGSLSAGLEIPGLQLAVLTDAMLTGLATGKRAKSSARNKKRGEPIRFCADLAPGELIVHEIHGIGRFLGIVKLPVDGAEKDFIKIGYAGNDTLYVPCTQLDLVSKYIGGRGTDENVRLSKMGGADWTRVKTRAKKAAKEMAKELISLYAARQRLPGNAFDPDSPWQKEFEDAFGYTETDDQLRCVAEIKADMERAVPMDRLLCGDVGYGKTEVALRAVMKCVLSGYQAAILVPTTVLAQQHYQTAIERFFGYPVRIDVLSRFRTAAQIKAARQAIANGETDIVIGTHALLQKDLHFKKLGLLVVDEEQRFGVSHKERLKEMSKQVDVLTLSATPIPRTLNMALSGIRDMSLIEEPPFDRLPVQTFVLEHDWETVCDAINREIRRGGQVYYLHNRVENIEQTASRIRKLLPDVSIGVAHGKMSREELYTAMEQMQNGETQVLVCTTIIETGIDIPNVNTLIIEDADKLGLAQLHQIRGRVGRGSRRASAYLTFRRDKVLTEIAEKRLNAIREFAEFNSGFRIAMRDLEIRGAGDLLGAEQSGNMSTVGYEMYMKLLSEAVLEEKGEKPPQRADCAADLAVSANIPESYVRSAEQRMDLYRRIAMIRTEAEADDLTDELIDRYGDPPSSVNTLVHVALLRGEAGRAGITDISQKAGALRFVLSDFDMARVSLLYGKTEYKGRLRVEAGQKPCLNLMLRNKKRVLEEARRFVADWEAAGQSAS